jgi:hypothetical protein
MCGMELRKLTATYVALFLHTQDATGILRSSSASQSNVAPAALLQSQATSYSDHQQYRQYGGSGGRPAAAPVPNGGWAIGGAVSGGYSSGAARTVTVGVGGGHHLRHAYVANHQLSHSHGGAPGACRHGWSCVKFGCTFSHPPSRSPDCVDGAACSKRSECAFLHPRQKQHRTADEMLGNSAVDGAPHPCKHGPSCVKFGCTFGHPDTRPADCAEGGSCAKGGGCELIHPRSGDGGAWLFSPSRWLLYPLCLCMREAACG